MYKARFTSSSHKSSSAWTYSHLKYQVDPVSDQAARDNLALSIGLLPQMHDVCFHCKSSTTTPGFDPQSHCVGCAASNVHPVAGKIVELAVIKACKKVFTLKNGSQPNYKDQPSWDPVRQVPKLRSADALIVLPHRQIIVDITFTSGMNLAKSNIKSLGFNATKKEEWKRKQIAKDYKMPDGAYIAMGFEAQGAWGDAAYACLRNRFDVLRDNDEVDKHGWTYMTQDIGNAIRLANFLYFDFCRTPGARSITLDNGIGENDIDQDEIEFTRNEMENQVKEQLKPEVNVRVESPVTTVGSHEIPVSSEAVIQDSSLECGPNEESQENGSSDESQKIG